MKPMLLRILKNGLLSAAVLAAMGYVAAEIGGMYLASQSPSNNVDDAFNADSVTTLRNRLPIGMAAWGFGLVALFEILSWLVRGNPAPQPAKFATNSSERLFDDLLKRAEIQLPAATGHTSPSAENSPGIEHPATSTSSPL